MAKIKEKFNVLKTKLAGLTQGMPKRVQWLLMLTAFVLVLILLTLLFGDDSDKKVNLNDVERATAEIKIEPDIINWAEVLVGDTKSQEISITASADVNVLAVNNYTEINGLNVQQNCTVIQPINKTIGCKIFLKYEPTTVQPVSNVSLFVEWHDVKEPQTMKKESKIVLTLGAQAPIKEPTPVPMSVSEPEPKPEPKPEPEPEEKPAVMPMLEDEPEYLPEYEEEPEYVPAEEPLPEPEPVKENVKKSVNALAPAIKKPTKKAKKDIEIVIPDGCSDFAFPAYGTSGKQIGWVKPSRGAYYYHPFADKDCTNAEGTYNPDNGIITDDSGKKIGTDAEHIGLSVVNSGVLPELKMRPAIKQVIRAKQKDTASTPVGEMGRASSSGQDIVKKAEEIETEVYLGSGEDRLRPTRPYDRQFILRQYKPIPATIVSEVRADPEALANSFLPVRATVDRNVYSDSGRNVIIPAGTLMLGYVTGELPGPYASIGRMSIKWYQFVLPNGMEYNFAGDGDNDPFSGDAQGREGVLGRGSTDYLEQFFMPMLTSFVPAAINLINPVADAFVNQIDLDNNTVVQSGTVRSSELAKSEIISAWNAVAQKLMLDMMNSSVPPFTIAAGTRITVYSPVDLVASCGDDTDNSGKKCALGYDNGSRRSTGKGMHNFNEIDYNSPEWIGQSRAFQTLNFCECDEVSGQCRPIKECRENTNANNAACGGYSYQTLLFWCQSQSYQSKKALQYEAYTKDQTAQYQNKIQELGGEGTQQFNEEILGIQYNDDGTVVNPYENPVTEAPAAEDTALTCMDGSLPDENGCCAGEIYTDMGEMGFNCCPEAGGDCFPPLL